MKRPANKPVITFPTKWHWLGPDVEEAQGPSKDKTAPFLSKRKGQRAGRRGLGADQGPFPVGVPIDPWLAEHEQAQPDT